MSKINIKNMQFSVFLNYITFLIDYDTCVYKFYHLNMLTKSFLSILIVLFLKSSQRQPYSIIKCKLSIFFQNGTGEWLCHFNTISVRTPHIVEILWKTNEFSSSACTHFYVKLIFFEVKIHIKTCTYLNDTNKGFILLSGSCEELLVKCKSIVYHLYINSEYS